MTGEDFNERLDEILELLKMGTLIDAESKILQLKEYEATPIVE